MNDNEKWPRTSPGFNTTREAYEHQAATVDRIIARATPTDDEREALRIAHLDARQAAYRKEREDWYVDHEAEPEIASNAFFRGWDAAVDGDFRRTEVPEPSAEAVIDDETDAIWQAIADALGGFGHVLNSHDETAEWVRSYLFRRTPEPQGEPSDAQVAAALSAWRAGQEASTDYATRMRAALRAANEVR